MAFKIWHNYWVYLDDDDNFFSVIRFFNLFNCQVFPIIFTVSLPIDIPVLDLMPNAYFTYPFEIYLLKAFSSGFKKWRLLQQFSSLYSLVSVPLWVRLLDTVYQLSVFFENIKRHICV